MKKILLILTTILLFSCEDVLVEKPKLIAVETFYRTNSEVESAIGAIIAPLREINLFRGVYITMQEAHSDYFVGRGSFASISDYQGLISTNITRAGNAWKDFYLSIRNANLVIKNVPNGGKISEENKNIFIAEAKFLRALVYFYLVRNWGGVPLHTEENMDEIDVPRSTITEVYQLIISDLNFAENNLPDNAPIGGRASKWAAKTVLADVYFYQGMHVEASEKALEVIQSGKYSLVEVSISDDFENIFGAGVVSSSEEIFYLKYSEQSYWTQVQYFHGVNTPYTGLFGYMAVYTFNDYSFYTNWDDNDLRKIYNLYLWDFGLGSNTMLIKKFSSPGSSYPGNDFPMYRYTDLLLLYAEASCQVAGSPTTDGMEKLNMVHRRAFGFNSLQPSPVDFDISDYDKQSFTDLVIRERGYETIGEGKRWLDLKRTGKVKEYIKVAKEIDVAEKHLLWPIPVIETNYNKAINPSEDQNPGY
ncbi:MAG: RagB/SusD family nutrient uptake outer membrane protein [Bacteroidales bacterium]|nr:RagB/SusD family nutrient uptake outer membrane protein [Bacteroidales bacterium]